MNEQKISDERLLELRETYEKELGRRIRLDQWKSILKQFKNSKFELNEKNLISYARLKIVSPKAFINGQIIEDFITYQNVVKDAEKKLGLEYANILQTICPSLEYDTIYRIFARYQTPFKQTREIEINEDLAKLTLLILIATHKSTKKGKKKNGD